jgi:hypothetical protein
MTVEDMVVVEVIDYVVRIVFGQSPGNTNMFGPEPLG